jgi:septal ring factor EnvC (AmiA/AmiB activator)
MKAGTLIFLIVVILIVFGFILNDDINTHRRLNELLGQIDQLTSKISDLEAEVASYTNQVAAYQTDVEQKAKIIEDLQGQIATLRGEITQLKIRNAGLQTVNLANTLAGSKSLLLAGFLALQVTTSVITYRHKIHTGKKQNHPENYVRLSREELALIIKHRRSHPRS